MKILYKARMAISGILIDIAVSIMPRDVRLPFVRVMGAISDELEKKIKELRQTNR